MVNEYIIKKMQIKKKKQNKMLLHLQWTDLN